MSENAHEIPIDELAAHASEIEEQVSRGDTIIHLTRNGHAVAHIIPDEDAWFWTPEWQAKERQADEEIRAGAGTGRFHSMEELFADLDAARAEAADEV
ncbi:MULTISPECIES: type II toxin-antitoxin system Phd/YefM family antitoxin [Streptosporangium]|nr:MULTISPECIES: type II toxin-antitoxin system Phd/YefM family antitoxin [Streptosporangium]